MPELPDVETFRRHIEKTSLNREVTRTRVNDGRVLHDVSPQLIQRRLKGNRLEATQRHGKHLFVKISADGHLALHFGMTGFAQFVPAGEQPPEHARVVLEFADGAALAYVCSRMFGRVSLTDNVERFLKEHELGSDALALKQGPFCDVIRSKESTVKSALMDQSAIAGVGNVYSDEVLFQLGWHPKSPTSDLTDGDLRQLYRVVGQVLKKAVKCQADPDDMPSGWLTPQRAAGMQCPSCGGELEKWNVSGRNAIYCPACQGEGRDSKSPKKEVGNGQTRFRAACGRSRCSPTPRPDAPLSIEWKDRPVYRAILRAGLPGAFRSSVQRR